MSSNLSKRLISLPILISIVLLPCFLIYFLHSEYNRAKKTLTTEVREKTFESILIRIDDFIDNKKDSLPNNLKNNSSDSIFAKNKIRKFLGPSTISSKDFSYNFSINDDTVQTKIKFSIDSTLHSESNIFSFPESTDNANQKIYKNIEIKSNDSNYFNTDNGELAIFTLIDESGDSFLEVPNIEASFSSIFKRIIPQTILSIVLLASVWLSLFLSARGVRKERQLTAMRNDFMSNITHELKTPVSTISIALEALKNFNAADNKQLRKEYIDISKSEVDRLSLLVDKALNLSLYEQGKFVYEKQIINLDEEILRIIQTLKIQLNSQNVSIEYEKIGKIFSINADKIHITNVIHNLIENAIKYSKSSPEILINLEAKNDLIHLRISDKGIGIPSEYQSKIFDKFFRVPHGNTHNIKGHGLGLSYVKEIIERHGGFLKLTSELGQGSTFIISLPKTEAVK